MSIIGLGGLGAVKKQNTTLQDIKNVFAKGSRIAKLKINEDLTYFFDLKDLRIEHTKWGYHSNRQPLYYKNEKEFFNAIKRFINKQ